MSALKTILAIITIAIAVCSSASAEGKRTRLFGFEPKKERVVQGTLPAVTLSRVKPIKMLPWPVERPTGHVTYCKQNRSDCGPNKGEFQIELSANTLKVLDRINRRVNAKIRPVDDDEHYGQEELWRISEDGKGDCEDYVLEKRRDLMRLGWPASVLLITVVEQTPQDGINDGHAVLTVITDKGALVLDNLVEEVAPWQELPYKFKSIQSIRNSGLWVAIEDTRRIRLAASD